jgi:hypothetical protein
LLGFPTHPGRDLSTAKPASTMTFSTAVAHPHLATMLMIESAIVALISSLLGAKNQSCALCGFLRGSLFNDDLLFAIFAIVWCK